MNLTIRYLFVVLFVICWLADAFAQQPENVYGRRLSFGIDPGVTTGKIRDSYDRVIGGSLQADIPLSRKLCFTVNTGYTGFLHKLPSSDNNLSVLPVKAGFRYFVFGERIYVGAEVGMSYLMNMHAVGAANRGAFVDAEHIGILHRLSSSQYIEAGIRIQSDTSFFTDIRTQQFYAVRVAYAFNL